MYNENPAIIILRTEWAEAHKSDHDGVVEKNGRPLLISYFDIISYAPSESEFRYNLRKVRPDCEPSEFEIVFSTTQADDIARGMGKALQKLRSKIKRDGLPDEDVQTHLEEQQAEFNLDRLSTFVQSKKLSSIQACWLIRSAADPDDRKEAACVVLPRLMHMYTACWVVNNSFDSRATLPKKARLASLLEPDIIKSIEYLGNPWAGSVTFDLDEDAHSLPELEKMDFRKADAAELQENEMEFEFSYSGSAFREVK